jgi:signal transduction histidine kinase/DNA-binding response OmpR family regulator/ligand-binding sensor domain-containing protein
MGKLRIVYLWIILVLVFFQKANAIDTTRYRFHVMPETSYYGGIQSIAKDSLGRIWYTGPDAVFVYDGSSFYQLNELASASEPGTKWRFGMLLQDKEGRLFLTTNHGLLQFNYSRFSFEMNVPGRIRSIRLNDDGNLVMLRDDSLLMYHPRTKKMQSFLLPKGGYFEHVLISKGLVFLSQAGNLMRFDTRAKTFIDFARLGSDNLANDVAVYGDLFYFLTGRGGIFAVDGTGHIQRNVPILANGNRSVIAKKLYLDPLGIMWVATQTGLFLYHPVHDSHTTLTMNLSDAYSLPNNSIWTIYADPDQGVWLGTYGGKLVYSSLYDKTVRYFKPGPESLNHPIVSSFAEDRQGNIWIGTEGGGLNFWNRQSNSFSHYLKGATNAPNSNMIKSLRFDQEKKNLYIAAFSGGITHYDALGHRFSSLDFRNPYSQQPLTIYDFIQDHQLAWWMTDPDNVLFYKASAEAAVGVASLQGIDNKPIRLEIESLYQDAQRMLRFITHDGLFIVNPVTRKVIRHYYLKDQPYAVNSLCCYREASNGDLWLGTLGGGVNLLKADGTYLNFNSSNGFPPKLVFGILEDSGSKNIWLSTSEGIYYYEPSKGKFSKARFYEDNSCGSFYIRSAYKTSKGEMLFGGTNGFVIFDPTSMSDNRQRPKVFFTGFLVNNLKVTAGSEHSPLSKDISSLSNKKDERINLTSSQSNIEIRFSSNSYLEAEKNQFSYRMRGLSDEWQLLNRKQNAVQFFDLPAGDYVFEVKASNNDGLWGQEVSRLYIHVDPPFFLSWWAYLLYSLIAVVLLFFMIRYYTNKKVFKERLALEAIKEQNMRELNQARTNFFTNISHDLKTPLTLVLDPLKQLKETLGVNDKTASYMQVIEKNVTRIQRMISQLLRFREIESQKITLNPQVADFIGFVKDVFGLFELYANRKEIETDMAAHQSQLLVAFDFDIIEKILTNLFSNALKYTPNKGYVGVRVYESTPEELNRLSGEVDPGEKEYVSVEVLNTGDNFSEEQIATLFTSFNRLSARRPTFEESSGLGLAIVKELVDALGGAIWMVNKMNKISFTMLLPFKREANPGQVGGTVYDYTISELDDMMLETVEPDTTGKNARKANSVLLIEDDPSLRSYLEQRLSEKYNVYTASDGTEGLTKAEKIYPQLIITDLMMPGFNGFELCRRLRQNFKTSHIPIVMISGKGDDNQNKVRALEMGATVFIDKPFEVNYLLQQTETILKSQQELKEKYSKRFLVDPSNVTISSMDEELLTKAMKFIEGNIDNPDYSVERFVSDMNVGRTILYQKINDIVGMSIKEFIMNIRLKRSAYLLQHADATIAEIAYQTGFNNAKYFSICFKKQFEMSPSEFRKHATSEGLHNTD